MFVNLRSIPTPLQDFTPSFVYSIAFFGFSEALTQTLTQTAKKADGNNGAERAKKDMFLSGKGQKGAESTTK